MSYCDMPSVFDKHETVARQTHICCECRHPIIHGESYWRIDGCWDGEWDHYKVCSCCDKKRCALTNLLDFDDCVPFGELANYVLEYERSCA